MAFFVARPGEKNDQVHATAAEKEAKLYKRRNTDNRFAPPDHFMTGLNR
jgi:hypothetical protein